MLLKYKYDNDISLTEIGDVTVDRKNYCVDFKPTDITLMGIRFKSPDRTLIDKVINALYENGRADISQCGNCELFDCDDECEENDPLNL